MNMMFGYGTAGPNISNLLNALSSGSNSSTSKSNSKNSCQNATDDQYTKNALEQYGGNMMSGNVPGLQQVCPNYQNLNQSQREGFWTQFVDAVEKPESGCKSGPDSIFAETGNLKGTYSEGLLQLSVGDQARGAPSACNLNSSNILNAQTNITCGVAIMNGLSSNGITNNNKGMDAYWSTLRPGTTQNGQSTLATIESVAASYPGCH